MKHFFTFFFCLFVIVFFHYSAMAQPGGKRVYEFLNLPLSAKSASVGGFYINQPKATIQTYADNPAMLDSTLAKNAGFTYINYVAGINIGQVNYAWKPKGKGMFAVGMQYINYGKFTAADFTGQKIGEFTAGEYALMASHSRKINKNFSAGINSKIIFSDLNNSSIQDDTKASLGLAIDGGVHYLNDNKNWSSGLVFRNLGLQVLGYSQGVRGRLPFVMQWGTAYKVPNAPFRLNLILNNLQTWRLGADEGNNNVQIDPLTGKEIGNAISLDNILRKGILAVEVLLSENTYFNIGYNHNRRSDLHLAGTTGLSGFNFGLGFHIKKMDLNMAFARYHRGGNSFHLGLGINLSEI